MNRAKYLRPLAALMLLACGQDDSNTENGVDTAEQIVDPDTAEEGPRFEPDSVEALLYAGDAPVWVLTAKAGDTWLYIENYPSFGGAEGAETRNIKGVELNYATCGVCLVLKTGCQPHGDHSHCDSIYMPEAGGSVTMENLGDEVGSSWSGSMTPIRFIEVSMDENYETTPREGGDTIELGRWDFDVVLEAG